MPSLRERARRVRHHDDTALSTTQHHPANLNGPTPAVSDPATPNPAIPEPDPASAATIPEKQPDSSPASVRSRSARTRISGAWVAAIVAVVALVFLLIFILQNLAGTHVYFLGASGSLPMGVAMLFAAVAGALLIASFGSARVLQLRRAARRHRR
jgi:uncharacterized integral membrane protein